MRVVFGDCAFDAEARALTRAGQPRDLSPKAVELLRALVAARPQALSKTELHDLLWPKTFVSDTSLAQVVTELRKALGDDPRQPRYVRTIHRFGYAFCEETREASIGPAPKTALSGCTLLAGPREVPLHEGENLLGRTPESVLRFTAESASRRHARIVVTTGQAVLEDLGSKNGTFLNGHRLEGSAALAGGDEITIGRTVLVFSAAPPPGTTRSGSPA